MLSNTTLSFLAFINLFMIPITSLKIYCKRHSVKLEFTAQIMSVYALVTILNIPCTRILVMFAERILSTTIYMETIKYTIISIVSSTLLPFIMECIEKFIQVNVEISVHKRKKQKQKNDNVSLEEINEN